MFKRIGKAVLAGVLAVGLVGCGSIRPTTEADYASPKDDLPKSTMSSNDGIIFGGSKANAQGDQGGGIGVNAYLWRGALDTLSFMPLVSADPFGGVIITDWFQPPASNGERFKATAYILGRALRADGVRVSVFRQVAQNGVWVDEPVSAGTTIEIENKVLARARELRSQSGGS